MAKATGIYNLSRQLGGSIGFAALLGKVKPGMKPGAAADAH